MILYLRISKLNGSGLKVQSHGTFSDTQTDRLL